MTLVIRNLTQFRQDMSNKAKAINKAGVKTQMKAAELVATHAKRLAPRGRSHPGFPQYHPKGETINGIIVRKISRYGYRCLSRVTPKGPSGFMQNFWANDKAPWRKPRMRWNNRQPTSYGDGSHSTTAKSPRFFDRAVQIVQKKYKDIAVRTFKEELSTGRR